MLRVDGDVSARMRDRLGTFHGLHECAARATAGAARVDDRPTRGGIDGEKPIQ